MQRNQRLFNIETQDRVRRETARGTRWVFLGVAVVAGLLVWGLHHEEPFLPYWLSICSQETPRYDCEYSAWLDLLAGGSTVGVFGVFTWMHYRLRRIRPTVRCKGCDARGWIEDLNSTAGRCPHCGHDHFAYWALEITGVPLARIWRSRDVTGQDLLTLNTGNKDLI